MKLPERKVSQVPDWVRSLSEFAQLPVIPPPDVTQFPTPLIYPDITQLPTTPPPPGKYPLRVLSSDVLPASDRVSSVAEKRTSDSKYFLAKESNLSRMLLYARIVLLFLSNLAIPFLVYALLEYYGFHLTRILYYSMSILLMINAYTIAVRMLFGLPGTKLPEQLALLYPAASAIVAAYLPNEEATIVETVKVMLNTTYPGPFQVILAYNTPYRLPVERVLQEIATHDRRLILLHVKHSNSKAENINRALREVTGTFVGIFDADHYPASDGFKRAWHWLSQEYHVVQGRCVVRNGDRSWITRLVAIEFEILYGLEYPARTRIRDFGIFGGANGYWRTDVLRKIDMNSNMFAESIDASLKALEQGYRIMHDPLLICRELAPETLQAFWNQRIRQAQGGFQVSLEHLWTSLSSPQLSLRQKLGCFNFLAGREVFAWLATQIIPLFVVQVMHEGWLLVAPSFIGSVIVIVSVSLLQVLLAYSVALPEIRRYPGWFIFYALLSLLFFTGLKKRIACTAALKELSGKRDWSVTPRSTVQVHTKRGAL